MAGINILMDQPLNTQVNPAPAQAVPTEQTTVQTPMPPSNKNNKFIIIALAIFVLVLLLAGGLWYLASARNSAQQATVTTYFSPEPTASASATPSDLTAEESTMDASLKQLDTDQQGIDQAINDKTDNFGSL